MLTLRLRESRQPSGSVLNRFLSILSALIFDSSVDRGMPNLAAAPVGPNTRPRRQIPELGRSDEIQNYLHGGANAHDPFGVMDTIVDRFTR